MSDSESNKVECYEHKDENIHYKSCYDTNGLLAFRKLRIKDEKFLGYTYQIKENYKTNGGSSKEVILLPKVLINIKKEEDKKVDPTIISFLASKNKGDREEATELLVEEFKKGNNIYTTRSDEKTEVYIYVDGIYIPDGKTYIQEFCREKLGKLFTTNICNQVIAKIEADTYINQEDLFVNDNINLIPVQNGILNIISKELVEFSPDYIFFNKLNLYYDPNINNNVIQEFFEEVLHKKDIPVIQELFGYCLYRNYPIHKAFMFNGVGRNGKGTTLNLIESFVNVKNITDLTLKEMETDQNFTYCRLHNKMVNISGDIDDSFIENLGSFKKMTGHDTITARRKFKSDINFKNYAKFIFACNDLPVFKDDSEGGWSRWILIDFPYRFKPKSEISKLNQIEIIEKKIRPMDSKKIEDLTKKENMTSLLNWAIVGLDRLLENGEFSEGNAKNVRRLWKMRNNSVILFVNSICAIDSGHQSGVSDFKLKYSQFCIKNKVKTRSSKVIKNTLEKEFGIFETRKSSGQIFEGISLNQDIN